MHIPLGASFWQLVLGVVWGREKEGVIWLFVGEGHVPLWVMAPSLTSSAGPVLSELVTVRKQTKSDDICDFRIMSKI